MKSITYPFEKKPKTNILKEIVPSIYWLRLGMPFSLDHINLWLIEEDNYWTLIDTGPNTSASKASWQEIFSTQLKNKPIGQIICTHSHPDHIGLAGWICEKQSAELLMSKGEFEFYHETFSNNKHTPFSLTQQFYQRAGASDEQIQCYLKRIEALRNLIYPMPKSYQQLQDNDHITLGKYQWQVHVGRGHSPEHVCLFCDELNLLISGDQLLPTISSNISVWPSLPNANPLSDFLDSCHDISKVINNQTLVLPSHGLPFYGGKNRLNTLLEDAKKNIEHLYDFCLQPRTVSEVFPVLFKAKIDENNLMLAFGEAIANLNYLCAQGRIIATPDEKGINYYQQTSFESDG